MKEQSSYRSMTSYAALSAELGNRSVELSLRSVNAKGLRFSLRGALGAELEFELRKKWSELLNRGTVELSLSTHTKTGADEENQDEKEFKLWLEHCQAKLLPVPSWSDFFARKRDSTNQALSPEGETSLFWQKHQKELDALLQELFKHFDQRRMDEGASLVAHITHTLNELKHNLEQINTYLPQEQQARLELFKNKIQTYAAELDTDLKDNLSKECAQIMERLDVSEEQNRLATHLAVFFKVLQKEHREGRYLDFLCQELNREINTLANKSQSVCVSELAVQFKTGLEKIREQVQNLL